MTYQLLETELAAFRQVIHSSGQPMIDSHHPVLRPVLPKLVPLGLVAVHVDGTALLVARELAAESTTCSIGLTDTLKGEASKKKEVKTCGKKSFFPPLLEVGELQ